MAEVGADVWVRASGPEAWLPARIVERSEKDVTVQTDAGDTLVVPSTCERESAELQNVKLRNVDYYRFPTRGRGGVDDLIQLTHLHEPAILDVLSIRYANDCIYTYTGPILLAVNPFQRLPLYGNETLEEYYTHGLLRASHMTVDPLPPHVYAVADTAYRCMVDDRAQRTVDNRNQSMLVSGESGAGKTETTKIIMQYLATVGRPKVMNHHARELSSDAFSSGGDPPATALLAEAGAAASSERASASGDGVAASAGGGRGSVEQRVLKSNPILEAFGNAKTLRNENSSRFGKYITMQFSKRGELVGASIETYLLEKVRLVTQNPGERNYHVFYQMCAGGSPDERARWKLESPDKYHFLNQSGCFTLREADDAEEYRATRSAMSTMGIAIDDQEGLFDALAGIMHLGNGKFVPTSGAAPAAGGKGGAAAKPSKGASSSGPECQLSPDAGLSVSAACELLGLEVPALEAALTSKEIVAGTERYTTHFTVAQASAALEAVTKALYGRLFLWVVSAINRQIRAPAENVANFVGVLDIFGFEHFTHNSFEQLCINYANETLQQQFNQFVFKLEQAEYTREAISFNVGDFPDNQDCLDLIEAKKPPGILALLDEQCLLATATDDGFARKLVDNFKENQRFTASAKQKVAGQFVIRHYAGEVVYTAAGFIEKNRDAIHREALELLTNSKARMVRTFFQPETWEKANDSGATPADGSATPDIDVAAVLAAATSALGGDGGKGGLASKVAAGRAAAAAGGKSVADAGRGGKAAKGGLMSETVGVQFKAQLSSLVGIIRSTTPHYVRCLKPNGKQVPKDFERDSVVSQLRCGGVLEAVRVARLGYPVRTPHMAFLSTYRCLATKEAFNRARDAAKGNAKKAAEILLASLAIPEGTVQVGNTKVFFRRAAFDELEARRQRTLRAAAVKLQAVARGRRALKVYKRMRKTVVKLQSLYRGHKARLAAAAIRRHNASITLQAFVRRSIARTRFLRFRQSVLRMQSYKRGADARQRVLLMRKNILVTRVAAMWRMYRLRKRFVNMHKSAITLQCWVRQRRAKALLDRYRREAREVGNLRANNEALKQENRALAANVDDLQRQVTERDVQLQGRIDEVQRWKDIVLQLSGGLITSLDQDIGEMVRIVQERAVAAQSQPVPAVSQQPVGDATHAAGAASDGSDATAAEPTSALASESAAARAPTECRDAGVQTDVAVDPHPTPARAKRASLAADDTARENSEDPIAVAAATAAAPAPGSQPEQVPATPAKTAAIPTAAVPTPVAAPLTPTPVHLSEIATLKARLADAERRADSAEKQVKEIMAEIAGGRGAAPAPLAASGGASSEDAAAGVPAAAPAGDLMEFTKKRTQKLEAQLQRAETKVLQLEKRIAGAEKAATDAAAAKMHAEQERAVLTRENERLKSVVDSLQNHTVAAYQKQADELTVRVATLQEENGRIAKELGALRGAHTKVVEELRDKTMQYIEADDERSAMRQKVASDKQTMFQISRMIDAATGENRELKAENETLHHRIQMLQGENRIVREQAQRLSEALANLQQQRHVVGGGHLIPTSSVSNAVAAGGPDVGGRRRLSAAPPPEMHEVPLTGSSKHATGLSAEFTAVPSPTAALPAGDSPPATPGTPGLPRTTAAAHSAVRPPPGPISVARGPTAGLAVRTTGPTPSVPPSATPPAARPPAAAPAPAPGILSRWFGAPQ